MPTKEQGKCVRNQPKSINCLMTKKIKGTQLQINDLVLVKRVAWKGRHKIQNKWEPEEYLILSQPNKSIPVYKVKHVGNGKERVFHRNMLLPLGIKFVLRLTQTLILIKGRNQSLKSVRLKGKFLKLSLSFLLLKT